MMARGIANSNVNVATVIKEPGLNTPEIIKI
jgi:hypothetical protein